MANSDKVLGQVMQDAGEVVIDTSRKLKVGIIGTGWIAESHIQSYKNMPDVEVVALADLVPGKAEEFAKKLGIITKNNKIIVNEKMETNVPGIYACGDCTEGLLQISKAVYQGTVAGLETIKYLRR